MIISNIFYLNEIGEREKLEDTIFPSTSNATKDDKLFIVCDGVGGRNGGEIASYIACDRISDFLLSTSEQEIDNKLIENAIYYAKDCMHEYAAVNPEFKLMSTTFALVYLLDDYVLTAWCGDSRIYHIRNGNVIWQSKDHSLVQRLIDEGDITEEEALCHPERNIITQSLNARGDFIGTDIHFIKEIKPNDYIMLCTDGLLENIKQFELMDILGSKQIQNDKQKLFLEYCDGKTDDNFSMYLLKMDN